MDKARRKELVAQLRKSRNREVMSEFIRIGTSDLYDYQKARATLREIAFLQVNDEKAYTPPDSPFAGDYVGWCYASQLYIAERVGYDENTVWRHIQMFEADRVIKTREWRDNDGHDHKEYHVDEDTVTAHQRVKGADRPKPRRKRDYTDYENKGAFKKGADSRRNSKKADLQTTQSRPTGYAEADLNLRSDRPTDYADSRPTGYAEPLRSLQAEGDIQGDYVPAGSGLSEFDYEDDNKASSVPPSAGTGREIAVAFLEDEEEIEPKSLKASGLKPNGKANGSGLLAEQQQDQKQKPNRATTGVITKGEKKLPPNWKCYPELFKGRVSSTGEWLGGKIPKCKRCAGLLHPDENHECPGYLEGGESHLGDAVYQPIRTREELDAESKEPKKSRVLQNFDDLDEPEEDDLSGDEDYDDDTLVGEVGQ